MEQTRLTGFDGEGDRATCPHEDTVTFHTSPRHYDPSDAPNGERVTWCRDCSDVVHREVGQ